MKSNNSEKLLLISRYNLDLVRQIINNQHSNNKKVYCDFFNGNLEIFLMNKKTKNKIDYGFIFEDLSDVSLEFKNALMGKKVDFIKFKEEIKTYLRLINLAKKNFSTIFMSNFEIYEKSNLLNIFTHYQKINGAAYLINAANNMISDFINESNNLIMINNTHFSNVSMNYTNYYTAKFPLMIDSLKKLANNLFNIISNLKGETKKLIICDLDNTLWGGILGDVGYEKINLGGHDLIGEAHQDLQKFLKHLKNQGVMLAISSKNEIKNVAEAFKKNKNMILSLDDFVEIKCNWEDKAKNINEILKNVNITSSHAVFIDDSEIERERVQEIFPDIECPKYFQNILNANENFFKELWFHNPSFTKEDKNRTSSYLASKEIKNINSKNLSSRELSGWIKKLNVKINKKKLDKENLNRTIQLFNKTNQLNTITRRLNDTQLKSWLKRNKANINLYYISDKFADYGLTAILTFKDSKNKLEIYDFLMSCRIMGRNVENQIIDTLIKKKTKKIEIKFTHSKKNKPMFDMLCKLGFVYQNDKFFKN
jgi:FkbH-like protein